MHDYDKKGFRVFLQLITRTLIPIVLLISCSEDLDQRPPVVDLLDLFDPKVSFTIDHRRPSYIVENDTVYFDMSAVSPTGNITSGTLHVNGEKIDEDLTEPYRLMWIPAVPGNYLVQVRGHDDQGETGKSFEQEIQVAENQAPTIEINFPTEQSGFSLFPGDDRRIVYTIRDAEGDIANVKLWMDGAVVYETGSFIMQATGETEIIDLSEIEPARYETYMTIDDNNGKSGSTETIEIDIVKGFTMDGIIKEVISGLDANTFYALDYSANQLMKIDAITLSVTTTNLPELNPVAMELSEINQKLYIISEFSGDVTIYDIPSGTFSSIHFSDIADGIKICIDDIHRRIYVMGVSSSFYGPRYYILDMDERKLLREQSPYDARVQNFRHMALDEEQQLYAAGSGSPGRLYKFDVSADSLRYVEHNSDAGANAKALAVSPTQEFVVMPAGGGNGPSYITYAFERTNLNNVLRSFDLGTFPVNVIFTPSGELLLGTNSSPHENFVYVYDSQSGIQRAMLPTPMTSDDLRMTTNSDGSKLMIFTYDDFSNPNPTVIFYDL